MSQFITFTVGAEEYGVDVMTIREIKGWTAVTALPETPPYVRGVIDLRGAIVPIFDLRTRFGGGLTEATPRHVVVVLAVHGHMAGILVDAVADILTADAATIQPVPDMEHVGAAFIDGLVTTEGRMVALLDLNRLFDAQQVSITQPEGNVPCSAA
jgi:purine-binding chemotaxis protein CheW